ncbi:Sialoadhesin Sialic acid-binding Ig-like lectin 1 [Channa argus]|uniref:Sialoadhesin Sialic acid-binding Ig-like lectin 1 n=1 Tax=Channa argus TaxID=215402 RepID=A0A6G1PQH2_CHAAH|nr:Sialoadhesin Sialic acid-binding Ig-like lectin 1 [Channa argus]
MTVWDTKTPCGFLLLLAGVVGQSVQYPDPVCAVKGSTVILPCTFKPIGFITDSTGRHLLLQLIKVRWCQNHRICQSPVPSVYDSQSQNNNPRYEYLGDLKGNCTLQIRDLQKEDEATLRFRMEMNHTAGHFTEQSGVNVTVVDSTQMRINNCTAGTKVRERQTVTLHCAAPCTFHQLEVTWFRDGHALLESGPDLRLGPLTAKDYGNYTCALKTKVVAPSQPCSLFVDSTEEGTSINTPMTVHLILLSVHTVLIVIVVFIVIKRTCACRTVAGEELRADTPVKMQVCPSM